LIFQLCFDRCLRCGHRQEHLTPFKKKMMMYTYRFEEYVPWMLIGSNEEPRRKVGRRRSPLCSSDPIG
jgi:hypothetical protein